MEKIKSHKSFGGWTEFYKHLSEATKTDMSFSVYLPCEKPKSCLIWLSGLTCNEENFITKSGVQSVLSGSETMVICPDTSPRGLDLPNEHESYDFGSGAGFYLNAVTPGYKDHYRMYDYVAHELIQIIKTQFGVDRFSIMGHSMGGHGALVLGLTQSQFVSVSAFSPIVNPMQCSWGQKAFRGYLGEDQKAWKDYDACELIQAGKRSSHPILIDQGLADEFYPEQLLTKNFETACAEAQQELQCRYHKAYDHSYYFIASFIAEHVAFHQKFLN